MKIIILDTNFLMVLYKYRIDIFSGIENLVPEAHNIATLGNVIKELEGIQKGSKGADRIASKIALQLIQKEGMEIIKCEGPVDESIMNFSLNNKDAIICTNDKKLRKKLKENGVHTICMRDKSRLEFC